MNILYLSLFIIFTILLLLVNAIRPNLSSYSLFELERRSKIGDKESKLSLLRVKSYDAIILLINIVGLAAQTVIVCFAVLYFNWVGGIFIALFIALICGLIASLKPFIFVANKIYSRIEKPLLRFFEKHPRILEILSTDRRKVGNHKIQIKSREELLQLVAESDGALNIDEKRLIANSLTFKERMVSSVMTPRDMINSVDRSEFLGPVALDELHKSGHSHLPVINGDVDHIIGILNLGSLLSLDTKRSVTAERAMDQKVYYIREGKSLYEALSVFLRTQNRLLIVVNQSKTTVGVVILKDVIEALVGHHDSEENEN